MKKVWTRETLDAAGCGESDCHHDHSILFLHPRCHIRAGTRVRYEKPNHLLIIECIICKKEVARIVV